MIIAELKSGCQIMVSEMGILIAQRFHFGDMKHFQCKTHLGLKGFSYKGLDGETS